MVADLWDGKAGFVAPAVIAGRAQPVDAEVEAVVRLQVGIGALLVEGRLHRPQPGPHLDLGLRRLEGQAAVVRHRADFRQATFRGATRQIQQR